MKRSAKIPVNGKIHLVKGELKEELRKLENDQTLESEDKKRVGGFKRKVRQADNGIKLYDLATLIAKKKVPIE
jgi:hypothetical protein